MKRKFKDAVCNALIILLVLSCKKSTNSEIKRDLPSPYNDYIEGVNSNVKKLSPERKSKRDKWLLELKSNSVYVDLVDSSSVSVKYLPVLNAISDAIKIVILLMEFHNSEFQKI